METTPALFISHGAPDTLISNPEIKDQWRQQVADLPLPNAIVIITAHWETPSFSISGNIHSQTIHDFSGFADELYEFQYPSPAAEDLANELHQTLELQINNDRGLDHGSWVPLIAMYPQADIPVVQLSVAPSLGAAAHFELGQRLSSLRERNILIVGSGSIVHNLRKLYWHEPDRGPDPWANDFMQTIRQAIEKNDWAFLQKPGEIPGSKLALPSIEHYLPLLVTAGAVEENDVTVFSDFWCYGNLGMHSFRFTEN